MSEPTKAQSTQSVTRRERTKSNYQMQAQLLRINEMARLGRKNGRYDWTKSARLSGRAVYAYNTYARNAQQARDREFNRVYDGSSLTNLNEAANAANRLQVSRSVYMGRRQ